MNFGFVMQKIPEGSIQGNTVENNSNSNTSNPQSTVNWLGRIFTTNPEGKGFFSGIKEKLERFLQERGKDQKTSSEITFEAKNLNASQVSFARHINESFYEQRSHSPKIPVLKQKESNQIPSPANKNPSIGSTVEKKVKKDGTTLVGTFEEGKLNGKECAEYHRDDKRKIVKLVAGEAVQGKFKTGMQIMRITSVGSLAGVKNEWKIRSVKDGKVIQERGSLNLPRELWDYLPSDLKQELFPARWKNMQKAAAASESNSKTP